MRRALAISSVFVLPLATGCVYALHPYNTPSQEKLHIRTSSTAHYVVRVADTQDYPVAATGCVTFDVPRLPRSCAVSLFGLVKVSDDRSKDVRAVHLLREGTVVRKFSLIQLGKLPLDSEGYHTVVLR